MTEDLTPKQLKCEIAASCPSIHRLDDGRLRIVGEFDRDHGVITEHGKPSEAAIVISPDLLGTLIEERVRDGTKISENLAAMIMRMQRRLARFDPDTKVHDQARDLLKRYGFGSPLRSGSSNEG